MPELARKRVLGSSVNDLIGGRWAISLIAYAVNAPVNLIVIGSNAGSSASSTSWTTWLAAAAVAYVAFGLVFLLAHLTAFRHRAQSPRSAASVVALGAVAGGVRGLVLALIVASWGLASASPGMVAMRIGIGVALGAILVPLVAFALGSIDAYRSQRTALLFELRRLRAATMAEQGITRELEAALMVSVQDQLDEVVRTRDPAVARDVSHQIWNDIADPKPEPRMRWSSVLRASVQHNPFAIALVATIWSIAAIGTLTTSIGLTSALAQIAFSVAAIAVCFAAGRRLTNRHPRHAVAIVLTTLSILVLATGPLASAIFDPRPWPAGASLIIANSIWLPLLTLATGFVMAALRSGEDVLDDLCRQVSEDELAAIVAHDERERLRRELATRLHGTVQSRLLAASLAPTDSHVLTQWINGLQSLGSPPATSRRLSELVDAVVDPWSALMEVLVESPLPDTTGVDASIIRVLEEALANSFRHGRATRVRVSIVIDGNAWLITVQDNGIGLSEDHSPGLGQGVLSTIAPDAWEMSHNGDGTCVTARITN